MKNKYKNQIKVMATAASLCMIMAASTTAYAKDMFDLKDVQLCKNATQSSLYDMGMIPISNVGLTNSNEGKALEEWLCFLEDYDKDEKLLRKGGGTGKVGLDPKYDDYGVYTKEMADKLDSIVKKYNLKLQGKLDTDATVKDVIQKAGSGNFLGANICSYPYLYEDGSFKLTGLSSPESGLRIGFSLTNFKKGTFNDSHHFVYKINDCKEWDYTTTCGIKVHLAMSPEESFVFADLGDSFMQITANTKGEYGKGKITSSSLEAFANSFDFSLIKSQAASSLGNKTGKMKVTTRDGIIGEFQTLLSRMPETSEVYAFIKDKAKNANKEEVTEMLINLEATMADRVDYTKLKELSANATEDMIAYLDMMVLEQTNPCIKGNSLAIGWDKLIDRAISAGEFMKKYPSSDTAYDAKRLYEKYQRNIFGIGPVSPFDKDTKKLKADVKKVFETSISNNPNSELTKKLKEFLEVVSQNGNKENKKVNDFRFMTVYGVLKR